MKRTVPLLLCLSVLTTAAPASQQAKAVPPAPPTKAAAGTLAPAVKPAAAVAQTAKSAPAAGMDLESVLDKMDAAAANFQTLQANFVWDQLTSVVNEHSVQKGTIYFRRTAKGTDVAIDVTDPGKKYVVVSGGKARMYEPNLPRVTEYDTGKNRAAFESFLALGFGGRGHDLAKSYNVKLAGAETVDGVNTAKLLLTPKSPKVQSMFAQITLWIDPAGISIQQQFTEPSGDYKLAKYTDIKKPRLSDDVFKLKTPPGVEVVRPQG